MTRLKQGESTQMRINAMIGEPDEVNDLVVLVDVFRSSTSIVTALDRGCDYIRPFKNPEDAKEMKRNQENDEQIILVGEKHGRTIEGFDLNISPTNLIEQDLQEKKIFYRSSNLTRVLHACIEAEEIIIGGLINAGAVADYISKKKVDTLDVVACGISESSKVDRRQKVGLKKGARLNKVTIEDLIGAGKIIHHLESSNLSDLALIARLAYRNSNWKKEIGKGFIAKYLTKLGYGPDLDYCTQENEKNIVPLFRNGKIKKA